MAKEQAWDGAQVKGIPLSCLAAQVGVSGLLQAKDPTAFVETLDSQYHTLYHASQQAEGCCLFHMQESRWRLDLCNSIHSFSCTASQALHAPNKLMQLLRLLLQLLPCSCCKTGTATNPQHAFGTLLL